MKQTFPIYAIASALLAAASLPLAADTIRLKDGTVLEGKILRQSPESIEVEYNISKSIKDIRTIARSEIADIDQEQPDEIALKEIKALLPTASLLSAAEYQELLDDKPAEFLGRFKDSKLRDQVQVVIDQLEAEKTKVEAGGIKIEGKWITGEDAAKDPYNHAANIAAAEMKAAISERDYIAALSKFEMLEKDHPFTVAYVDSVKLASEALPRFEATLASLERGHAALMKQREDNLKTMEPTEREITEKAFADKLATFEARREADADAGKTWLPVTKWHLDSIKETRETIAEESERLAGLDLTKTRVASTILANAIASCAEGKLTDAASQLAVATTNGARGPAVDKLSEDIRTAKIAADEAARAALAAATTGEGGTNPTDPDGTPTGDPDDPETTGAETPKDPETEKPVAKAKPKPKPSSKKEKGGLGIQGILMIAAGLLIVVTVLAKLLIKPAEEEIE